MPSYDASYLTSSAVVTSRHGENVAMQSPLFFPHACGINYVSHIISVCMYSPQMALHCLLLHYSFLRCMDTHVINWSDMYSSRA